MSGASLGGVKPFRSAVEEAAFNFSDMLERNVVVNVKLM